MTFYVKGPIGSLSGLMLTKERIKHSLGLSGAMNAKEEEMSVAADILEI